MTGTEDILPTIQGGNPSFPGTLAPRAALRPLPDRGRSLICRQAAGRDNCLGLTLNRPWANWRRTMIETVVGDLTGLAVDCIVNAAIRR